MITRVAPSNEPARLAAVEAVTYAPVRSDPTLDDIAAMTAETFAAPIVIVSLTEREAQSAISTHGVGRISIPRDVSICTHTVAGGATLIVGDALSDSRFQGNPFVLSAPFLRFYAGALLYSADGHALGTLCILDTKPRADFGPDEQRQLERFARLAEQRLQARALQKRLTTAEDARLEAEAYARDILQEAIGAFVACDRLSLNLEGRLRAGLMRVQRAYDGDRANASEEVAALRDLIDELAIVARHDRTNAKGVLFEPSATVRAVAGDLLAYAAERNARIDLNDDAPGVEMLGDSWRFEELIEGALSDCIAVTHGAIAVHCRFETLPSGEELFAIRLRAEKSEAPWRISARNRELIDAMAGGWELSTDACAIALFLPARLRTAKPVRGALAENVISLDRSRKGSR